MIQNINLGAAPNDKTGTKARVAGQIINANFAYLDGKIDNKNYLEVETGFSLVAQTLTMNANWKWVVSGIEYTNPVAVEIVIPLAASGKSRIDLIVCNTSNTFSKIAGEESIFTPVAPGVPANTIFATFFTASDGVIGVPVLPKPKAPVVSVNGMRGEVVLGINDISDLRSELDSKLDVSAYNQHFKGVYLTEAALIAAHPTASVGDYAQVNVVGVTDVVNYNWDAEENIWVVNAVAGGGATNTDALPEGSTNLYFTVARFLANLTYANVIAALGFTPSTAPNDAQKNSDITKAEIEAKLTGEISTHTHQRTDVISLAMSDSTTALVTGDTDPMNAPYNFTLVNYWIGVKTAPTISSLMVDVKKNGTTVTSTKAGIDATEKTSLTGTTPVITTTSFTKGDEITPNIYQVGSGESGKALKLYLEIIKT